MFFVGSTKNMLGTANKNKTVQTIYHDVRYISKCFVSFLNYPAFPYAHPLHTHTHGIQHFAATLLSNVITCMHFVCILRKMLAVLGSCRYLKQKNGSF